MEKFDFTAFKQSISLSQYAASQGYELDPRKSTRSSLVMRHANGDKIVISKKGDVWVYFSVFDEKDNGTIIDFVKHRTNKTFAEIGKELTAWTGSEILPIYSLPEVQHQVYDRARIKKAFAYMKPVGSHPYLINERKIPVNVLDHYRFKGRIFRDNYANIVFPHHDEQGVCGLELKNHDKSVFMRGSEKALWLGNISQSDTVLTLAESAIDALSHFTLFEPDNTAYGAVSGGMRDKQFAYLLQVIAMMPQLAKIVLAVDNDKGGTNIAERIEKFLANKFSGEIIRHVPQTEGMDWNNVLKDANSIRPD